MENVHGVLVGMLQFLVLIISPADNQTSNFLVLGQRPYGGINDSTGAAEKIL